MYKGEWQIRRGEWMQYEISPFKLVIYIYNSWTTFTSNTNPHPSHPNRKSNILHLKSTIKTSRQLHPHEKNKVFYICNTPPNLISNPPSKSSAVYECWCPFHPLFMSRGSLWNAKWARRMNPAHTGLKISITFPSPYIWYIHSRRVSIKSPRAFVAKSLSGYWMSYLPAWYIKARVELFSIHSRHA